VVAEKFAIPARHEANISVRMETDGEPQPTVEWAVESQAMKSGVRVAHTLLGDENMVRVARILNQTNSPYKLEEGNYFATAKPVITYRGPAARSSIPSDQAEREWEWRPGRIQRHLTRASVRRGEATPAEAKMAESDCSHVQCLIDGLPDHLTPEKRVMAERFIRSRANIFSRSEFDIGRTDILKHRIDTGDNPPHYERLRRHPTTQLPLIDAHVEEMLKHDVIEPAASPWCSNVVMVKKKDGSMRFCIDYRKTNELIKKDHFPLPKIDNCLDCLDMLNGSRWFSSCDLRQGYWQTVVEEEDRDKTAFVTWKGEWHFKVLSFGLCNAPSQFAHTMELVLAGLTYDICLIYLDDILIFSRTFEEHCQRLSQVFDRLERQTLRLKASKCHLFQEKVTFLGHVVSERGIECDQLKTDVVANWPRPSNVADVRSFCGLASYYRNFVEGFAKIAHPLHDLTKKNAAFVWTEACEEAFVELKKRLTSAPILAAPTDHGEYILDTDASDFALGAVLQQKQDDGLVHVIAYGSRSLSGPER